MVAWIVAGTAVLLLLFSRLFTGAIPVPQGGNAGASSTLGPGTTGQYQYQYQYQGYPRDRAILPQNPAFGQAP